MISSTLNDFTLDIAINQYNAYFILLGLSIGSLIIQVIYGLFIGFTFTSSSIIYILIRGFLLLLSYILYIKSLKHLPIALASLIESGTLFVYLIIDWLNGSLKIDMWFLFLFLMFLYSIFLFSIDTYKYRKENIHKKIQLSSILILFLSMTFSGVEPFLIRGAHSNGANEISISIGYYLFSIPYFFRTYIKKRQISKKNTKINIDIIELIFSISVFESVYYIFGTLGYMNDLVVINAIIQEIQIFLIFILSVMIGSEKLTLKKVLAIIMGTLSVIGIYLY